MFSFYCANEIYLRARRGQSSVWRTLFLYTKQKKLGYIPKIKSNSASIGSAIFSYFFPYNIGFVLEPPSIHYSKAFWKKSIGNP